MSSRSRRRHTLLEGLERRTLLDGTYHSLASGSFTQDWSNTALITTNNVWDAVPSIIGYRGDGLVGTTAVDPQTVLIDGSATPVNVIANQATPNTNTTGGIAEFELANPVVAFQGSGTARAPHLVIHIDSTGVSEVSVSYLLRDIDGSNDNSVQPVALQYRVGGTGDYINVPAGFVADASEGPGLATLETPVTVTLPPDAGNQANLQIRIMTTDAIGSDEWIGVDNIAVANAAGSPGTFNFSSGAYSVVESDGSATITVSRLGGSSGEASVRARTILGGTASDLTDYNAVDTIVNFADGQTSATFNVTILNDSDPEPSETVLLEILEPTGGATVGAQNTATLTILDDDTTAPVGFVLNEVSANPPGSDGPWEYVEFRGTPDQPLFNTYFVSVDGDGAVAGVITLIQDLGSATPGSNGLLMLKAANGGHTAAAGTNVVTNAALDGSAGALQNGSNSFLVIFSPTPLALNQDLDTDNDGNLDLPAGATLVDGIGWLDGSDINDRAYGATLSLALGFPPPDAASRFVDNLSPLTSDAWFLGDLAAGSSDSLAYNLETLTTSNPSGPPAGNAALTPGASNFEGGGDTTPPTVDASGFVFDAFPTLQTVTIAFSEDVSASLTTDDIQLLNLLTSTQVASGDMSISYDTNTNIARVTFPNFQPNGSLPDGRYRLTLPAGSVQDASGNTLQAEFVGEVFFVFSGDANRDEIVNLSDFAALAANFNQPGLTFSAGDFDYDGSPGLGDFAILAAKFNQTLPPALDGARTSGTFSSTTIGDENEFEPIGKDLIA